MRRRSSLQDEVLPRRLGRSTAHQESQDPRVGEPASVLPGSEITQSHPKLAVALLKSRYRWCLTGTPITNKLEECVALFNLTTESEHPRSTYPLMRFVGIRPYDDW